VGFTYPKHQLQREQDYVTSELKTRAAGYPIPIYIIGKFCGQCSENNWPNAPLQREVQLRPYAKKKNRHILADKVGVVAEFWLGIWEVYGSNL